MESRFKSYVLIALIGLGLSFEAMKWLNNRRLQANSNALTAADISKMEIEPYHHVTTDESTPAPAAVELDADTAPEKSLAPKGLREMVVPKGKKTAKTDKKKKKKNNPPGVVKSDYKKYPERAKPVTQAKRSEGDPAPFIVETPKDNNGIPRTYEEWANLILGSPNSANVVKLVRYYQNGMVQAAIFYKLVSEMLKDGRDDMKNLGLYALRLTPSLRSFEMMAAFVASEPYGSKARTLANNYLNEYTSLNQVNTLAAILNSTESFSTASIAANLFVLAAQTHLGQRSSSSVNTSGTNTSTNAGSTTSGNTSGTTTSGITTTASNPKVRYFERGVDVLKRMTQDKERSAAQLATETLRRLQGLLPV